MRSSKRELELKLELTDAQLERARVNQLLNDEPARRCSTQMLRSTYYDTLDWRLRSKGISVRLRRIGDQWVQTIKADRRMSGGVSNPVEFEFAVDRGQPVVAKIPDRTVRRSIKSALGHAPLVPQFETLVERTRKQLKTESGDEVEVAIDKGVVRSVEGSKPIQEAELELMSGNPAALVGLAARLIEEGPLRVCTGSKADQGYRIGSENGKPRPRPQKAEPVTVTPPDSALDACREMCRSATRQLVHNWNVVVEQDDHEGPHQMRIGIRRLRTALEIVRTTADTEAFAQLDAKLQELARRVGEVRDIDVLAREIIQPLIDREPGDAGLQVLSTLLSQELASRKDGLRAVLGGRDMTLFQIELSLLPDSFDNAVAAEVRDRLERPIGKPMRKHLSKSWRRLAKRGMRLDDLDIEERHAMRKDLKRLRYAVEFGALLYAAGKVRTFLKEAARLQDVFGYLNDVAVARKLPDIPTIAAESSPVVHRAVGMVIGWHEARCEQVWQKARSTWTRLDGCKQPWS